MTSLKKLRKTVAESPGGDEFVELATMLSEKPENRAEAREVCFKGLTANPANVKGKLLLARLFYLDGMSSFALRELKELREQVSVPSLDRLLEAFGESMKAQDNAAGNGADSVIAEVDIDSDFVDAIGELED